MKEALIVDNHPLMRQYLGELLSKAGYTALLAEDGLAALDLLRHHSPQVMLVDLVMPNIDGRALCRIVRASEEHRDAFLLVMSAIAAEAPADIQTLGANAYVAKGPFRTMGEHVLQVLETAEKSGFRGQQEGIRGLDDVHAREITRELLELKQHFDVVLESMDQGVLEITDDRRIVYCNQAAVRIIGQSEERLLGSRLADLFEDRGEAAARLEGLRSGAVAVTGVFGERQVEITVSPFAASGAVAVVTDVTETRLFEARLREAQRLESIGTLAAGVAHDFNNLLMAIQGNASLILLGLKPDHPYYQRLRDIEDHIQNARRLTGQLLGYARKGRYEVKIFDLSGLVREVAETFGRARKEITLTLTSNAALCRLAHVALTLNRRRDSFVLPYEVAAFSGQLPRPTAHKRDKRLSTF